jgi:hypothetical protein
MRSGRSSYSVGFSGSEYVFIERWDIPEGTPEEVWDLYADSRLLPSWWHGVFLEAKPIGWNTPGVVGNKTEVLTRGFLPIKTRFIIEHTALERPTYFELKTHGDLQGIWKARLSPNGAGTRVDTEWRVTANKPILRYLGPVLKHLFARNHTWEIEKGEAGITAYIREQRRRGNTVPAGQVASEA